MYFKIKVSKLAINLRTGRRKIVRVDAMCLGWVISKIYRKKHMSVVGSFVHFALKLTMKKILAIATIANNGSAHFAKGSASVQGA
jgi:hypothetical protein